MRCFSDEFSLKGKFRLLMGERLDLNSPCSFNQKLQWLKIHDRNPLYTDLVDKYEVKQWVADRIGVEHIVPTIGLYNQFDDIDFAALPEKFVLKCTHDSGGVSICRDKSTFDYKNMRKQFNRSLKRNFYYSGREWPYKNVRPRIIVEPLIDPETGLFVQDVASNDGTSSRKDLLDYKFMCFNGRVRCVFTCSGRAEDHLAVDFFTPSWEKCRSLDIIRTRKLHRRVRAILRK